MKPAVYTNTRETVMTLDAFKAADFMSVWKTLMASSPESKRATRAAIRRLKRREARKRDRAHNFNLTA